MKGKRGIEGRREIERKKGEEKMRGRKQRGRKREMYEGVEMDSIMYM